jgi:hypothetical protein
MHDPVGDAFDTGEPSKLAVQRRLEQGLFHGQVAQPKPLLKEVNAQHGHQFKRRASGLGPWCMRLNQRQQVGPRDHQIHLVQKHRFARAPRTQIQAEVLLLHAAIVPSTLRSRHPGLTGVLNTIPSRFGSALRCFVSRHHQSARP